MARVLDKQQIIDSMKDLAQLDIDAWHAYDQAIDQVEEAIIRERLLIFQEDHHNHILNLSDKISELGGIPPEFSKDFKGFIIEGFTALRSMSGTAGALKAMQSNERTTNKKYSQALEPELPADVRALVDMNYTDEKRHLAYIDEQVKRFS